MIHSLITVVLQHVDVQQTGVFITSLCICYVTLLMTSRLMCLLRHFVFVTSLCWCPADWCVGYVTLLMSSWLMCLLRYFVFNGSFVWYMFWHTAACIISTQTRHLHYPATYIKATEFKLTTFDCHNYKFSSLAWTLQKFKSCSGCIFLLWENIEMANCV